MNRRLFVFKRQTFDEELECPTTGINLERPATQTSKFKKLNLKQKHLELKPQHKRKDLKFCQIYYSAERKPSKRKFRTNHRWSPSERQDEMTEQNLRGVVQVSTNLTLL